VFAAGCFTVSDTRPMGPVRSPGARAPGGVFSGGDEGWVVDFRVGTARAEAAPVVALRAGMVRRVSAWASGFGLSAMVDH